MARIQSQKLGDWDTAETHCRKAMELDDSHQPTLRELVKICAARENWPETVGLLTKQSQVAHDPATQASALLASAHIRMTQLGDDAGAEGDLCNAIDKTPDNFIAIRFLREIYYRQEDWAKLVDTLQKAADVAAGSQQLRVYNELGRLHDEVLRKPLDAAPYFEKCLEFDGRFIPAFLALDRIYTLAEDYNGLVKLYTELGEALGGPEQQLWNTRAARILDLKLDDPDRAAAAYLKAMETGEPALAPADEYLSFLQRRHMWEPFVEQAKVALEGQEDKLYAAGLLLQIGEVALVGLDNQEMAREHFDAALELEPDCAPAQEGKRLLLLQSGDWEGLIEHYDAAREASSDVRSQVAFSIKIGEIKENKVSDLEGAADQYRRALELAPNYLPARERLARALGKTGGFEEQAMVLEQTASLLDGAEARSATLYNAGRLFAERVGNPERAIRCLELSNESPPGSLLNLEALVEALLDAGKFKEAADTLQKAAAATEDSEIRVSLLYRAAQLAMGELNDNTRAEGCLRAILELNPSYLGATLDLREILVRNGNRAAVAALEEREAGAGDNLRCRYWWMFSAARNHENGGQFDKARDCYGKLLKDIKESREGFTSLVRLAKMQKDELAAADLYRKRIANTKDETRLAALQFGLLETAYQLKDVEVFGQLCVQIVGEMPQMNLPRISLGSMCEGLELWSEALTCYSAATEKAGSEARVPARYQCGLLAEEFQEDIQAATECFQMVLDDEPDFAMALDGLERLFTQSGDREGLARLYGNQAQGAAGNPVGTFYALLAGDLHHELNRFSDAANFYIQAFADPVGRERAFEALRRIHLRNRDGEELAALTQKLCEELPINEALARGMDLADGLVQIGDEDRLVSHYGGMLGQYEEFIVPALHLKVIHRDRDDWNEVLGTLEILQDRVVSKKVRDSIEEQINWVLREKFIDRPEAKGFFERLYDKDRKNPLALKGLGAICYKEEKYEDAFLYFDELKDLTDEKPLKAVAIYHLGRIADIKDGKSDDAAAAYEEALELDPEIIGPLDALFELHTRNENWQGLVGVLSRQASQAREKDKINVYAEIARVWEDKIDKPDIAVKSWQKVLSTDPRFMETYDRLMGLHEKAGAFDQVIEVGRAKVEQLPDDRRAEILFGLAEVAENKLNSEEIALGLYDSAANAPGSHQEALGALRRLAAKRGDWDQVVELAGREAEMLESPADRVNLYLERADVRLNKQLDRESAMPDFRRVLELDAENNKALGFFVDYYYDTQDWKQAGPVFEAYAPVIDGIDEEELEEDEDIREDVTLFHFKYGMVMANLEEPEKALSAFRTALELTPTHIPSLREAAPRLMELEEWKEAAKYYRQVLRLLGGFGDKEALTDASLNLGRCELRMGKPEAAVKRLKKILERNPNHVGALEGMTDVHRQNKDWNTLLSTYNAIIKYAKSADQVIDAYLSKGDILEEKLGYSDKAALHYEKVLMYDKTNSRAMRRLAEICVVKEDQDKAGKWAEVALRASEEQEDNPGKIEALLLQAISLAPSGEGMLELAEQALSMADAEREAVQEIKDSLAQANDPAEALKLFRKHFAQL